MSSRNGEWGFASVPPRPDLEDNGRAPEVELFPQLILQVAFVGEMQVHRMVDGENEGGGVHPDLCAEEQLHRVIPLCRLGRVGRGGSGEKAVQGAGRYTR